jgi:hypothetical protein
MNYRSSIPYRNLNVGVVRSRFGLTPNQFTEMLQTNTDAIKHTTNENDNKRPIDSGMLKKWKQAERVLRMFKDGIIVEESDYTGNTEKYSNSANYAPFNRQFEAF